MPAIVGTTAAEPTALRPDGRATIEGCNDELHCANGQLDTFSLDLACGEEG